MKLLLVEPEYRGHHIALHLNLILNEAFKRNWEIIILKKKKKINLKITKKKFKKKKKVVSTKKLISNNAKNKYIYLCE